jgi:hypothetical protein
MSDEEGAIMRQCCLFPRVLLPQARHRFWERVTHLPALTVDGPISWGISIDDTNHVLVVAGWLTQYY